MTRSLLFLSALSAGSGSAWMMKLNMTGKMVQFTLDTKAEVSAISDTAFRYFKGHKLMKPSKTLYGPGCCALYGPGCCALSRNG